MNIDDRDRTIRIWTLVQPATGRTAVLHTEMVVREIDIRLEQGWKVHTVQLDTFSLLRPVYGRETVQSYTWPLNTGEPHVDPIDLRQDDPRAGTW